MGHSKPADKEAMIAVGGLSTGSLVNFNFIQATECAELKQKKRFFFIYFRYFTLLIGETAHTLTDHIKELTPVLIIMGIQLPIHLEDDLDL